jgi:hypothetical protein
MPIVEGLKAVRTGWLVTLRDGWALVTVGTHHVRVWIDDDLYWVAEADASGITQGVAQHFDVVSSQDLARAVEVVLA